MSKGEFLLAIILVAAIVGGFMFKEFGPRLSGDAPVELIDSSEEREQWSRKAPDPVATVKAEIAIADASAEAQATPAAEVGEASGEAQSPPFTIGDLLPLRPQDRPGSPYVENPYADVYQEGIPPSPPARLDLNRATVQELMQVPGIGQVVASRIVEGRAMLGRFSSMNDLLLVEGIGPQRLEEIQSYFTVTSDGATAQAPSPSENNKTTLAERLATPVPPLQPSPTLPLAFPPLEPEPSAAPDTEPFQGVGLPTVGLPRSTPYSPRPIGWRPTPTRPWKSVNDRNRDSQLNQTLDNSLGP